MLQHIFDPALQQQGDGYAALGGVEQRMTETPSRQEVGVGENDFMFCRVDRFEVAVLNVTAMAQIVAHDETGLHLAALPYHQRGMV